MITTKRFKMHKYTALTVAILITYLCCHVADADDVSCRSDGDCKQNSVCSNTTEEWFCICEDGYTSDSGYDCTDAGCQSGMCYDCYDDGTCKKCVDYVTSSGVCVSDCTDGIASLYFIGLYQGKHCEEKSSYDDYSSRERVVVTVIVTVVVCFILTGVLLVIWCYWLQKKRRGNFELAHREYVMASGATGGLITTSNDKPGKFKGISNNGFRGEEEMVQFDPLEFVTQVDELRPHAEVFLEMLNLSRKLFRRMNKNTAYALTTKKVIHDLGRVLYILNKRKDRIELPPDGNMLMMWAVKALKAYQASRTNIGNRSAGYKDWMYAMNEGLTPM